MSKTVATRGPNSLPEREQSTLLRQVWDVVTEPMLLLLLLAGGINFAIAEPLDGFMLMFFVLVVIGISIYQEHKSQNALAALRELSAPQTRTIRDGREQVIPSSFLVVGDDILLGEGDRVPADAKITSSSYFAIDESSLTGESVPVEKGETETIFSGTLAVRGRATATVTAIGLDTELGKIGKALATIENEKTPLQREVNRLIMVIAAIAIAGAVGVAVAFAVTRGQWLEGLLAGIATAMAMLPEEFPVVLTIFMALGAWRMSRVHVLARRPQVIEALGSATVICTDKTGTLTTNQMVVAGFYGEDKKTLAATASLASALEPTDPMDKAFRAEAALPLGWKLIHEYPISAELLAVTQVWQVPSGTLVVAAKGAPEAIAALCQVPVSEDLAKYAGLGQRVLGVAKANHSGELPATPHGFKFEYLGHAGLKDPIRPGVKAALASCYRAGIRTIMITGDYPATALAIAADLELEATAGCLTGPEIDAMSDVQLAERLQHVNVFARMIPEQKLRIIKALKANGHVVAMTGDGVNDAPALKASDIGIAMGLRGTDVARESADLVLTDDDFSSIERGIRQGRGVFSNIRKAMAYIVAVHIPLLGMSLLPIFFESWPLVLLPILIAVVELIVDPACSVIFEAEQVDPEVMNQKPRKLGERVFKRSVLVISILQGLSSLTAIAAVYLWAIASGHDDAEVRSVTFMALIIGNIVLILANRSWSLGILATLRKRKNSSLKWLLLAVVVVISLIMGVPSIREAFSLGGMAPVDWLACSAGGVLSVLWFEVYKRFRK